MRRRGRRRAQGGTAVFYIRQSNAELADDDKINEIYDERTSSDLLACGNVPVPADKRTSFTANGKLDNDWQELAAKRDELGQTGSAARPQTVNHRQRKNTLLQLFEGAARDAGLLPPKPIREVPERRSVSVSLKAQLQPIPASGLLSSNLPNWKTWPTQ